MTRFLFILSILIVSTSFSNKAVPHISSSNNFSDTSVNSKVNFFNVVKIKYDTLIPILNGLFITHNKTKWGVIDSIGNEVVPFICDGIKSISDTEGIASLYSGFVSLNTNISRYEYFGTYFYFTKNGRSMKTEEKFELHVEMRSDDHNDSFIIESGPYYYLPDINNDTIQERSFRFGRLSLSDK